MDSLDNNCGTDVIFLDIHKAFDQVGHAELLLKLRSIGIVGLRFMGVVQKLSAPTVLS